MNETISYSEMERQYDREWVLLEDPETDEGLKIKNGIVLWHSKDRDEVYRKARELKPKHSAVLHIGKLPHDMVIVL